MMTEAEIKELLARKTETKNLDCKESLGWSTFDVTGEICTKWNERESTWRKSGSCQSRGTSQSKS
jgi:hypothetical protein